MKAWTDYPFTELGDIEYQKAPVREVRIISYDGNKYCHIEVGGIESSVKLGYLYQKPGRLYEVPKVSVWKLHYADGTPYWKLNKRRERKTTWVLEQRTSDRAYSNRREVDTLREALALFYASPVGTLLSRDVRTHTGGQFENVWERANIPRSYAGRVKKQRRGRK